MPNPFELTALEDPAEMYDALPRGAGRIAFPSGDVRSFQFAAPSPEDARAALRLEAARQDEFDRQKREAEELRQLSWDLIQSGRVDDVEKGVEHAQRALAMRKYGRDFRDAKTRGMDDVSAASYSILLNPFAFSSGAQEAALRAGQQPTVVNTPGGESFLVSRSGVPTRLYGDDMPETVNLGEGRKGVIYRGRFQALPNAPAQRTATPIQELAAIDRREEAIRRPVARRDKNQKKADEEELARLAERRSTLMDLLQGGVPQGTVTALPPGQVAPPVATPASGVRVKRKSDGKIFTYKGQREDIPTDQYTILN